ncbi:MAG: AsmA-like C-terminal region-containing protein, partial [Candidatus Eisenbacteria bacterium]
PLALEGLAFDLFASEQGADLAKLSGRLGRSTFEGTGLVRGWGDPRVRAHLVAADDLADLARFLPLADSVRLSGRARIAVDGAGRIASGAATDFGWSGRVDLAGVAASGVGAGRPIEGVSGTIGLAPGRAWATALTARVGQSDLTLDGTVEQPLEWFAALTGRAKSAPAGAIARIAVRARRLDLDELLPTQPATTPLPPVRLEGTFEVASLHLRKLDAERARGRFTYGNGVTAIDEFALDAYGGSSSGRAWLDFRDRAKPHYQLAATARDMDANAVMSAWTKAKDVAFGTLQMTIDLDGSGLTGAEVARGLTVKGLAQVLGGRLAGATVFAKLAEFTGVDRFRILSFRDLSAPFRVVSGRVVFDPLAVASEHTDWLARGSVGLDGTLDFALVAVVPPDIVPQLPRNLLTTAGALMNPDGRLTLDLKLGGTVQRPSLAWDSRRTASRFLESSGMLVDLLARQLGVSLGDSLARSATIEEAADRIVEEQKEKLAKEVERRSEDLASRAIEELTDLFEKKTKPPPPPAAPPDSTATAATSTAPPPPPEPPPAALDSSTVPAAPPAVPPPPPPAAPDTTRAPADTAHVP